MLYYTVAPTIKRNCKLETFSMSQITAQLPPRMCEKQRPCLANTLSSKRGEVGREGVNITELENTDTNYSDTIIELEKISWKCTDN